MPKENTNSVTDQNSNKTKKQYQESKQIAGLIDTFQQFIRTTSNLRFEIRELAKKMDTMDQRFTDTIVNTSSTVRENNDLSCGSSWDLLLSTIENLQLFKEKLSDKLFRKKVINQLSRYERSTIAETTRQMTSKIFHNNLLSQYSYHGHKYKSLFCSKFIVLIFNTFHQLILTTSNLRFEIRELDKKMDQRLAATIVNISSTVRENNDLSYETLNHLKIYFLQQLKIWSYL
ncbi:hypothetical protein AGLY_013576 [Aphis glycines]|uniref:DUF4806 domain-containing protein n=1 Tax=Aphis glycines TaxID=307491 RepID=A0A6G0T6P9_APHGL|nr:hypothetical protein AGLY_013576 [Aphis glycines]